MGKGCILGFILQVWGAQPHSYSMPGALLGSGYKDEEAQGLPWGRLSSGGGEVRPINRSYQYKMVSETIDYQRVSQRIFSPMQVFFTCPGNNWGVC